MPRASKSGFFHKEEDLDPTKISDFEQIVSHSSSLELENRFDYRGVILLELTSPKTTNPPAKRQKTTFRAVVLGQGQNDPGRIVLYRGEDEDHKATHGLALTTKGGVGNGDVHWASGLQIKWARNTATNPEKQSCTYREKALQKARETFCNALLHQLNQDQEWKYLDWSAIRGEIDAIQDNLDVDKAPKEEREENRKKATAKKSKSKKANLDAQDKQDEEKTAPDDTKEGEEDRNSPEPCMAPRKLRVKSHRPSGSDLPEWLEIFNKDPADIPSDRLVMWSIQKRLAATIFL